jgi:hypothetical protein
MNESATMNRQHHLRLNPHHIIRGTKAPNIFDYYCKKKSSQNSQSVSQ